jgi:Tfp pilus assembly protein PilV
MNKNRSNESGMTLVETMIAVMVLLVGMLAMAQLLAYCVVASKTTGRDTGKAAALAQDKMEELTGLHFSDTTTNVTVAPPFTADGVGLTPGGSIPPTNPVANYADYVDLAGTRTTAGSAAYTRQWQIINDSATLKRIIVSVTSRKSFRYGTTPSATIVTLKAP